MPSTTHVYSVDAFDLANDHSAQSTPITISTPAESPDFIQGAAGSSADRIPSYTLTLTEPVLAGDLLVGWFGQFDAPGEVMVSDDVNGPWTRSVATTWSGKGDIALYYLPNSAAAPSGLAITVSASAPTYLQEAVAGYRHAGALDQVITSQGVGTSASVGPSAAVLAGELVVAAVLTGDQPGWASAESSQMVPYLLDVQNGSAASDLADILSSTAGPQQGNLTLGVSTNWYMVLATFSPATSATTSTTTTTLPGNECDKVPSGPTFRSLDCRLATLIAGMTDAPDLGPLHTKLQQQLEKAKQRQQQSETRCRALNLHRAKSNLAGEIRSVIQVKQTLRSRKAKQTMPAARRDALLGATGALQTDLRTLRGALRCPADAV